MIFTHFPRFSVKLEPWLSGWLYSGNILPVGYFSLDDVLDDELAVRQLFTIHSSVDYLVSNSGQISSANLTKIFNNDYVAKWINLRDYALDTLYADSTIKTYMDTADKYFYGEWCIIDDTTTPVTWGPKGNVPVMTSNTAPYGEVICSGEFSQYYAWRVFDGNINSKTDASSPIFWADTHAQDAYIGYRFTNPIEVTQFLYVPRYLASDGTNQQSPSDMKLEYSDDGVTWTSIQEYHESITTTKELRYRKVQNSAGSHLYWRLYIVANLGNVGYTGLLALQFYGRELKVSVPTMTSNTAPYGEAFSIGYYDAYYEWKAFANSTDRETIYASSNLSYDGGKYLGYDFEKPIKIKCVYIKLYYSTDSYHRGLVCKLQGSNDKSTWVDIENNISVNVASDAFISVSANAIYRYYRILSIQDNVVVNGKYCMQIWHLQFYGLDYSEYDWDEDNPRHYIYDHGVELEEIVLTNTSNNALGEKKSDSLLISKNGANSSSEFDTHIDLTDYNYMMCVIGDNVLAYDGNGGHLQVNTSTPADYMNESNRVATTLLKMPTICKTFILNVSSVNAVNYAVIGVWSGSDTQMKNEITEWWLE